MPAHLSRRSLPLAIGLALVLLLPPAGAGAAPVSFSAGGGTVTLSSGTLTPGARVAITGSGFIRAQGTGLPIVAVKPDDTDTAAEIARWHSGGPSALPPYDVGGGEIVLQFVADADGDFSGYVDVPADLPAAGPGAGPNAGEHWLRFLSGLLSTDNASPTGPINIQAFFKVVDLRLGMTSVPPEVFHPGTVFAPGNSVTPKATGGLTPSTAVTVALDGTPVTPVAPITTDVAGALPASARVVVPPGTTPGAHTLTFATGAVEVDAPLTVIPAPSMTLMTPALRAGGTLVVRANGFRGITGAGQKVGVTVGSYGLKACLSTDAAGDATAAIPIPADATAADVTPVRLLAGASCVPMGVQDDLPGRVVQTAPGAPALSATAPFVSTVATASPGGALALAAQGFAPGEAIAVALDGAPTGTVLTAGGDGTAAGSIALPAGLALTPHTVLLTAASGGAATQFTAVAAQGPGDPPPGSPPPGNPPPGDPPKVTPTVRQATTQRARSVKRVGGRLQVSLAAGTYTKLRLTAKTAAKVRLTVRGRARILTVAAARTVTVRPGRLQSVTLTLSADARRALTRLGRLRVVIRVTPAGGRPSTVTLLLER